ncbi:MAG: aromatic ring-hydroxylating dioxygenase subunit alpha [Marinobacterium sp.]|nr:aromatic ring-hydroxylating dioxygenase subunit alpha [Marinobacterium sp.]
MNESLKEMPLHGTSLLEHYQRSAQAGVEQARCLPLAVYNDPAVYVAEVSRVFHNDWVFACAEDRLLEVGQYYAMTLAGEPVVLIRGKDGELRALSNLCRHRGTPLLDEGYGKLGRNIVCPYHAWTFSDTGEFKGAPMTGEISIDKAEHCLPRFAVASWHGLIFINLAAAPQPFSEKVVGLAPYLTAFELSAFTHSYQLKSEHWQANWKLAVENGIESYHLFKVHKETLEAVTPTRQAYYVAGGADWSLSGGKMQDNRSKLEKLLGNSWLSGGYPEAYQHYLLIFLPPSFIGVLTYEGLNWIHILPQGPEHCSVTPGGLLQHKLSASDLKSDEIAFTHQFLLEDQLICERVQRGTHARKGQGGKLVSMEKILVDFRQYLARQLFGAVPDACLETAEAARFKGDRT